jgi:type II secretory pathway component HofQ
MMRFPNVAVALAIALSAASLPAMAAPSDARKPQVAKHDRGGKGAKAKFPMAAADFRKHVDQRVTKARARLEAHITRKKLADDKAKEARAKFDAVVVLVNKEVEKVIADGTVTKEEAKQVHDVVKALHRPRDHKSPPAKR